MSTAEYMSRLAAEIKHDLHELDVVLMGLPSASGVVLTDGGPVPMFLVVLRFVLIEVVESGKAEFVVELLVDEVDADVLRVIVAVSLGTAVAAVTDDCALANR